MNRILQEVLEGREDNYLLPFFWQHDGNREGLPLQIEKIRESGCRALCVESRPYEGFCGPDWWTDMGIILREAQKRDMKVWILDDKHFPTGYANGLVTEKYPERRRFFLREHHLDLLGPMEGASVLIPPCGEEETLLSICAYWRTGEEEELTGEPILFPVSDEKFLYWDVPEGCYRLFFVFQTRRGTPKHHEGYIDMLSHDSVQVLIEAVYEPHWQHFKEYFGNTLAGFFSDEPSFDSQHLGPWGQDTGFYYRTVGQPGVALPWNAAAALLMEEQGIKNPLAALPALWYPHTQTSPEVRLGYMDAVTKLWREHFSHQLGDWCRAHNVSYIGHVIEDTNAHARLGCSAGHYFRSLDGQDMSGIDIVLHQVMPGLGDYMTSAHIGNGVADPAFFHYVLAQLGASQSRLTPHMEGRAMCEVFGAFGWAEGAPFMKWLMDFLLVRGINRFVPHAFTDFFPDPDCPPHFYGDGNDPQFAGFSKLMGYVNRASHLLSLSDRQTPGAILYHAEAEWMNGSAAMLTEKPAKILYDSQIDYDIAPLDALETATVQAGSLLLNGHAHAFLVIPYAKFYPQKLWKVCKKLRASSFPIFFMEEAPVCDGPLPGEVLPLHALAQTVKARNLAHDYGALPHLVRAAAFKREAMDCFMLFNESVTSSYTGSITLPRGGNYLRLDLLNGVTVRETSSDGVVPVHLTPYQSELLVFDSFGEGVWERFPTKAHFRLTESSPLCWEISLKEQGKETDYRPFRGESGLFNITGPQGEPDFSGMIRYRTTFKRHNETNELRLDLGTVGQTAQVFLNNVDMGIRICTPYCWDLWSALRDGENQLEIVVCNTLVQRLKDPLSQFMQIPPSGLLGPVTFWEKEQGLQ